jgi:type IV pilus assembly protein PilN
MIRINLLPFRAARKKENIRRQLSIYVLSVVCLLLLMGLFS